jgi:FdhD protein
MSARRLSRRVKRLAVTGRGTAGGSRDLPEETAVALTLNGTTLAVMMASPGDLEDFAAGFLVSEGVIGMGDDPGDLAIVDHPTGIDLQISISRTRAEAALTRRRLMAGPAGCGLCGIESLEAALRPAARVGEGIRVSPAELTGAMAAMAARQELNRRTRAVHAAGFLLPGRGLWGLREDVGRHNALDKLIGGLARGGIDPAAGVLLLSSRVSVELVQKAAAAGITVLAAVSAPTALALDLAGAAGMTVVAILRGEEFEVFTHPDRIVTERLTDVA